jgi:hypothetical protein
MHTADSTATEVAASKIAAARIILAGALLELEEGTLRDAEDAVTKAGGKLIAASTALAAARREVEGIDRRAERRRAWHRATGGGS